jgi:hypothetical protein
MTPDKPDRFGGVLFLAAGASFGLSALFFILIDAFEMRSFLRIGYLLLALFFLTGLGCPAALAGQTPSRGSFDRWVATLATVGFALGLIDAVKSCYVGILVLPWPEGLPPLLQRTDPLGMVIFPTIGLWVLANSLRLRQLGSTWRTLGNAGLACGALLFAPPVTETLSILRWEYIAPVFGVVALLMSVTVFVWFGGVGLRFIRHRPS